MKNFQQDIDRLYDHAKIANEEMASVKATLGTIQNDIGWIKTEMSKMGFRIENMKLGVPPWMVVVFSVLSGLIIYLITH